MAFTFLDEMQSKGRLSGDVVDALKARYRKLHETVLRCFSNERALLEKAKQLTIKLEEERGKIEEKIVSSHDTQLELESLRKDAHEVNDVVSKFSHELTLNRFELDEMESTLKETESRKEQNEQAQLAALLPRKSELQREAEAVEAEIRVLEGYKELDREYKKAHEARIAEAKAKVEENDAELTKLRAEAQGLALEPERVRKEIAAQEAIYTKKKGEKAIAESTLAQLIAQQKKLKTERDSKAVMLSKCERDLDRLQTLINSLTTRRLIIDESKKAEALRVETINSKIKEMEMTTKALEEEILEHRSSYDQFKKRHDKGKHDLDRQRRKRDALESQMQPMRAQYDADRRLLKALDKELEESRRVLDEIKLDEDLFMSQLLNKQRLEKDTEAMLIAVMAERKELDEKIRQADRQERALLSEIATLSAHRELVSRDASKASAQYAEGRETLKIKNMLLMNLDKQTLETYQRLKLSSLQYEKVKNSRNRFQSLFQTCVQSISELRERVRILQSEADVLRQESLTVDRKLVDEVRHHSNLLAGRDAARVDQNKLQAILEDTIGRERQQESEVLKLNSIVSQTEMRMLELRRDFAAAVDSRNLTGMQLIDRNDELCILYEKANLQQSVLNKGEVALKEKEAKMRTIKLEMEELRRKIELCRSRIPSLQMYRQVTDTLQKHRDQLAAERMITKALDYKLENPSFGSSSSDSSSPSSSSSSSSSGAAGEDGAVGSAGLSGPDRIPASVMALVPQGPRSRLLKGSDPSPEILAAKVQVLGARLNERKEQLLERELVLDEVTSLSDKLRVQAAETRGGTLDLAKRLNDYQGRIRTMGRKIMATISELSMYQATSLRLQQQKTEAEAVLSTAQERLAQGIAPTDDAEYEWFRLERDRMRRQEALVERAANEKTAMMNIDRLVRTTAKVRPNHYLPEELSLPKPYGALAPFYAQTAGSTMRHIRKPQPRELDL